MVSAEAGGEFEVEVVYALPGGQTLLLLRVAAGTTVGEAIVRSGVLAQYPEIQTDGLRAGIFGRLCALDTPLNAGDRVEIYRPLIVEPKEARRRRARIKKLNKTDT
jgi:putative ubiquitin-RnfH superfamily antitoxin RatB of RatAB toxin-antitoxin module